MKFKTVPVALLSLALVGVTPGIGAEKPKKDVVIGKSGGAMLSKEQLRTCMSQKALAAQFDEELGKEQIALGSVKDGLARSGEALKLRLETLDRTNAEAVTTFNEESKARDQQIDAYEARVTAFNARVQVMQGEREAYSKACENRRYLEDDEIAIKKGK